MIIVIAMNGLSGEEAIAYYTERPCIFALYSMRLLRILAMTSWKALTPRHHIFISVASGT